MDGDNNVKRKMNLTAIDSSTICSYAKTLQKLCVYTLRCHPEILKHYEAHMSSADLNKPELRLINYVLYFLVTSNGNSNKMAHNMLRSFVSYSGIKKKCGVDELNGALCDEFDDGYDSDDQDENDYLSTHGDVDGSSSLVVANFHRWSTLQYGMRHIIKVCQLYACLTLLPDDGCDLDKSLANYRTSEFVREAVRMNKTMGTLEQKTVRPQALVTPNISMENGNLTSIYLHGASLSSVTHVDMNCAARRLLNNATNLMLTSLPEEIKDSCSGFLDPKKFDRTKLHLKNYGSGEASRQLVTYLPWVEFLDSLPSKPTLSDPGYKIWKSILAACFVLNGN